jgi:ABC-type multidrug transport system fused ATPase/permease subunit
MLGSLRRLLELLPPRQRLQLFLIAFMLALGALLETLGIGALLPIITVMQSPDAISGNRFLASLYALLGSDTPREFFIAMLLSLLGFFLLKSVFLVVVDVIQYRFLAGLQSRLSNQLLERYLHRPYTFHLTSNSAQLIRNVTSETHSVFHFTLSPLLTLTSEFFVVSALLALALLVDPVTALIMILSGTALVLACLRLLKDRMLHIGRLSQESTGLMIQTAQEGLGGIKELKILGRESYFVRAFSVHSSRNARALRRGLVIHNFPMRALELVFVTMFVVVMAYLAFQDRAATSLPLLAVYAAAAFRLIPSLNRIMTAISRLKQGSASLQLVARDLAADEKRQEAATSNCPTLDREIRIAGLCYVYPGAPTPVLEDISLRIRRGEMVAFVGKSGSGKTTLVDCIAGLLLPTKGSVSVDGFDIRQDLDGWRRQIGYIPQHVYLIDDSLRRNIALGVEEDSIDADRIRDAIAAAQLTDLIATLPDGLDTHVGERGARLSGGQQQRIGIARAMYHDPPVLILDEATSALDTSTERAIVQTIAALKVHKTILVIAHRHSTIEDCDRVLTIVQGHLDSDDEPVRPIDQ